MKKINQLTLIVCAFAIFILAVNITLLSKFKISLEHGVEPKEWMSLIVAASLLVLLFVHVLSMINLFIQFKAISKENFFRSAVFVLGFFSFAFIFIDVVMLSDIGKEYLFNNAASEEWKILFVGQGTHFVFLVTALIQFIKDKKYHGSEQKALVDELVYLTANQIGVVSSILGFAGILFLNSFGIEKEYLPGVFFLVSVIALIPYGFTAAYWFFTKRKESSINWYDEKQFQDINRSGFLTLLFSVILCLGLFLFITFGKINTDLVIFFPLYLFMTEFIFSGLTLFFSKRI